MIDRFDILNGAFDLKEPVLYRSRIDADGQYHSPNVCFATEGPFMQDGSQTTAAVDLSAKQYYAVKLSAARAVNLMAASTDNCYGILQNKPTSGQAAEVAKVGLTKASAGAAIAAGANVMANASGQLITWVSGAGNTLIGHAVEAAGGANVLFLLDVNINQVIT